jgi:hypothetical protein
MGMGISSLSHCIELQAHFQDFICHILLLERNVSFLICIVSGNVRYLLGIISRMGISSKPVRSQKEIKMSIVLTNTRNSNLYLLIALAIVFVAILAFTLIPSIGTPNSAHIPVTSSEVAYVQYIQGEKAIITSPLESALQAYRLGEKTTMNSLEAVLTAYHQGEKNLR